jgi:hypothetical protein
VTDQIRGGGLHFAIEQAEGSSGGFAPLVHLTLSRVIPTEDPQHSDVAFDPARHLAPGVTLTP